MKRWTILAPERLFLPDEIVLEILQRCDSIATIKVIVDELAGKFDAPNEIIMEDVK
jgi:pyrroloquinoline quinone biosynthesis protein D